LTVFIGVLLFYRCITYLAAKSPRFEVFLEGKPIYVIEEGMFTLEEKQLTPSKDDSFQQELLCNEIRGTGKRQGATSEHKNITLIQE